LRVVSQARFKHYVDSFGVSNIKIALTFGILLKIRT
jgi:hypothetical protein